MNYKFYTAILLIMPFGTSALKPAAYQSTTKNSTPTTASGSQNNTPATFSNIQVAPSQGNQPRPTPNRVTRPSFIQSILMPFFRRQRNEQVAPTNEMNLVPTHDTVALQLSAIPSAYLRQESLAMIARLARRHNTNDPLHMHRRLDTRVIKFLATVIFGTLFRDLPRRDPIQGPRRVRRQPGVVPLFVGLNIQETPIVRGLVQTDLSDHIEPSIIGVPAGPTRLEAQTSKEDAEQTPDDETPDDETTQEGIPLEKTPQKVGLQKVGLQKVILQKMALQKVALRKVALQKVALHEKALRETPQAEALREVSQQATSNIRIGKDVSFLEDLEKQMAELENETLLEAPEQDLQKLNYFAQRRYFKQSLQYMRGESNYMRQMNDFISKTKDLLATHKAPSRKWELLRNISRLRVNHFLKEHINPPLEAAENYDMECEGKEGPMHCVLTRLFFHHTSQDRKSQVCGEFVKLMIELHKLMEASKGRKVDEERCLRIINKTY